MTKKKSKPAKIFVLDTNVILHEASCIYRFEENDIYIPMQVIEELDNFKKGDESMNFNAREFCRIVDELSDDKIFNGGFSLGKGLGKLKVIKPVDINSKVKEYLETINVDAKIINLAVYLKNQNPDREVVLVSKDVNLRLKARALGVMAQDFLSDAIAKADSLYEPIKELLVPQSLIDSLYKSSNNVTSKLGNPIENQNFILRSEDNDSVSILARYANGAFKKIMKDKLWEFNLKPRNSEQAFAMDALMDPSITLVTIEGKAGTGKTVIALACALQQLVDKQYDEVLFTRQTISVGNKDIGFLPGDTGEKISPYMNGMMDNLGILSSITDKNKSIIDGFNKEKKLFVEPLSFIRGRSLVKKFFIIDEAQNLTPLEVKTITTRVGEGTKIVFIGDTQQIDTPYLTPLSNGFSYLIQKFKGQSCHCHVRLVKSERSGFAELAGDLL